MFVAIIPDCFRANVFGAKETDDSIKKLIQNWLKGLNDRDGGRERRRNKQCHPKEPCDDGPKGISKT